MNKNFSKYLTLKNIIYAICVVLGIISICMMFANAVNITMSYEGSSLSTTNTYTGIQAIFGEENVFAFSFMNFLTYVIVFVAILLSIFKIIGITKHRVFDYINLVLFLTASIFFFLTTVFVVKAEFLNNLINATPGRIGVNVALSLSAGPIVGGIFSILSAVGVGYIIYRKK